LTVDGYDAKQLKAQHARVAIGPGGSSFRPAGEDVEIQGSVRSVEARSCQDRFVSFPPDSQPVDIAGKSTVTVAPDGSGDFTSVQQAIDELPARGGTINIKPGIYREVAEVSKPHVRMIGAPNNPSSVVIVYDKSGGTAGGTFNSYTVAVTADDFLADGITFENDFSKKNPNVTDGAQAVALAVRGDRAIFRRIRVIGAQDSLYAAAKSCSSDTGPCVPARQYFEDCYVEGHVDFIFGDAKAYFHNCEIHAIPHNTVYLTAQSKRYPDQDSGYVFDSCKVTAATGATEIYFGRPWRPYSTVVFLNTELPAAITQAGWREWRQGETHSLETAFYAEYRSTGPGARVTARDSHSHQLSTSEVERFSAGVFLRGGDQWKPQ
jgi:pectin methylesterase-like acyl-CoA thioesterase